MCYQSIIIISSRLRQIQIDNNKVKRPATRKIERKSSTKKNVNRFICQKIKSLAKSTSKF